MNRSIKSFRNLPVYVLAFEQQQTLFRLTKKWPREETFSLIDQIRRSSRSVGANIAEAWSKRRYRAHFISKLTDADAELQETKHWLKTASECGYVTEAEFTDSAAELDSIGRQLGGILARADEFCL